MPRKPRTPKPQARLDQPPELEEAWRLASRAYERAVAAGRSEEQALEIAAKEYRKAAKVLAPDRT
jgi:hypothetical protein